MTAVTVEPPETVTGDGPPSGSGPTQPRWVRPSALALLAGTALLYLWNLSASGYANTFYAAAVQAGTKSWKAMFFGSLDSSNFITVDKPPMSLWPAEILGRIFGFGSWTLLVPQALEGVAAVGLLYLTVKRWFGPAAGLLAGALLALTPVAVLMFRFDNPDALMTLLLVAAAYAVTRAVDEGRMRWLLVAGVAMGAGFLTKSLQPFTVLPALTIFYLLAARVSWPRRIGHLLAGGAALVVTAGWWVLVAQLWPASSRPYIGGSTDNSVLGLAFGYNGLGRLTGDESGGGPGGGGGFGGGGMFGGTTGVGRLFNAQMGTQISWLLPAAGVAVVLLLAIAARESLASKTRNAVILWGGWLLVTGAVLSYSQGIIHSYYTVQLAPAIGALVAIGAVSAWRHRHETVGRVALAVGSAVTAWWSFELLDRSPSWNGWLRPMILVVGLAAAVAWLVPPGRVRRLVAATVVAGLVVVAGGSTAFALNTVNTAQTGPTPTAGPTGVGGFGRGMPGQMPSRTPSRTQTGDGRPSGAGRGTFPGGTTQGGNPGGFGRQAPGGTDVGDRPAGSGGGFGQEASTSSAVTSLLKATNTRWAAATIGDQSAVTLELATGGKAVMGIGGFSGSDPAPTLAQFKEYVQQGLIHYFVGGGGGFGGRSSGSSAISSWVSAHFTAKTVGGQTVYDLTQSTS